jgi:vanillate/4-hydroxybenzoate decarboxylase subunit D
MICPRCAYDAIDTLYTSPVPDAWDVLQCRQCLYCWRTSEPDRRTKPEAYPQQFKMTLEDIKNAPEVPTIPPLVSTPQAQLPAPRPDRAQ